MPFALSRKVVKRVGHKSAELFNANRITIEYRMTKLLLALLLAAAPSIMAAPSKAAVAISALTNPAKLATLKGDRAVNPSLQKCVFWLAYAEEQGEKPEVVLDESAKLNKTAGTPYAGFVSWGLLENLKIAKELGLLTPRRNGLARQGGFRC